MGLALGGPGGYRGFEETGSGVELWETVARAGNQAKDLRCRVEEVEDLRNQEETQGLGKMAENTDDGENHSREVAVCVTHENFGGVPVVVQERARDADPRE